MEDKIDDIQKAIESFGYKFEKYEESALPGFKIGFEIPGRRGETQELLVFFMNSYDVSALVQSEYNINVMNLTYLFSDKVVRKALPEIYKLTNHLNTCSILPGFGYDEESEKAFYRFCLPVFDFQKAHPGKKWLHESLRLIIDHIAIYSDAIGTISLGFLTFDELVTEAQNSYLSDLKQGLDMSKRSKN